MDYQKLAIITLVGVVVGMFMTVPTIFLSDVLAGGIFFGLLTGGVAFFVLRRKEA